MNRIDELNIIRTYMTQGKKAEAYDEIYEMLEMAFYLGANEAYDDLGIFEGRVMPDNFDELIEEEIAGKSTKQRINEYYEADDVEGLIKVADTEYTRLHNDSGLQVAKQNGATKKKWVTRHDDKVRDTHQYLDGMEIGIDDEFYTYDGDSARYPGDFLMAENNCNCRCALSFA